MQSDPRRTVIQDTFDLREQIQTDGVQSHADAANYAGADDEEHSILEDDSDGEDRDVEYIEDDDDGSSSLSIPNESIDFDLVYSLHSFAATVEGQANVVKGDSLFLMDDSNSYWWLVRVLKTQEVGYIPAENIETPFERLARLNKHRNVDLALATQAELQEGNFHARTRSNQSPSPVPGRNVTEPRNQAGSTRGVAFKPSLSVHRYPPAVWHEDEEEDEDIEWDDDGYEDEDMSLAEEQLQKHLLDDDGQIMEPDDGMGWDDTIAEEMQARQAPIHAPQLQGGGASAVRFGPTVELQQQQPTQQQLQQQQLQLQQQQQLLQAQQQQLLQAQQQQQLQQSTNQQLVAPQIQTPLQQPVQQPGPAPQTLRQQGSRERLVVSPDKGQQISQPLLTRIDPLEATETRKITLTPPTVREVRLDTDQPSNGPLLPSAVMKQQDDDRKRTREEIEALEESSRKKANKGKMAPPVSSASLAKAPAGGKLRKDQPEDDAGSKDKEKKKKSSVFGFFGRRKDKNKDKQGSSITSVDSGGDVSRGSEDSTRSGGRPSLSAMDGVSSPTTAMAMQQQRDIRTSTDSKREQPRNASPPPQVSQHASQLRQRDQQQQALYQQYLNRSPSSPPEAQANYGLQTAAVMTGSTSYSSTTSSASGLVPGQPGSRPRPGSLVLSPSAIDGQGVGVPELSVIRVFAGKNLQTEATFKTVLLNTSTTSLDLVRQAIQRFRLPAGEDAKDYYLTVKQLEGSSAVLLPSENPLGVFETLVEAAMELPKVKRSSVGSISSVASNLSMHPAITKLSMNDFTDDSAVKFYLNRRSPGGVDDNSTGDEGNNTTANTTVNQSDGQGPKSQYLTVSSAQANNMTPERFSSPSFRFAMQLVIYPDDLPDDMVFDPLTEAIVFKHTLRDRPQSAATSSSSVSQNWRRKVFLFPKNVTVAEVIELGLDRFGIAEGVVDGGDEVEDKLTKRRSSTRVRYGLAVDTGTQAERELAPSSRIIDAYLRPPAYRAAERQFSDRKRRSVDSAQLLGNPDDVGPADPVFILRRAVSYRNSATRHRISAPLDELALRHLHRESASVSSASSDTQMSPADDGKPRQPSKQEIIAAQRAATRANQRAILSAQTNSLRGVDVLLPGNAMIRSSRYEVDDRMRYSYVPPDGEAYDISDIIEQEWSESNVQKNDLLEGVLVRNKDGIGDRLDRVLSKIKSGQSNSQASVSQSNSTSTMGSNVDSTRTASLSEYSLDDPPSDEGPNSRASTPGFIGRSPTPTNAGIQRAISPSLKAQSPNPDSQIRSRTATPTKLGSGATSRRQPSIASVMSDLAGYSTSRVPTPKGSPSENPTPRPQRKRPIIPQDDFGISHMMAIIEYAGSTPKIIPPPMNPVDEHLYGRKFHVGSLHPEIQSIYADSFKKLDDVDQLLDEFVQNSGIGLS